MINKEHPNIERGYPLKGAKIDGLVEAAFTVPDTFELPLKIEKIQKIENVCNFIIADNEGKFVGIFTILEPGRINMLGAKGCSGWLTINEDFNISTIINFVDDGNNLQLPFELHTTKLYNKYKIDGIQIRNKILTGDVVLKETQNTRFDIQDNVLYIKYLQEYDPKCFNIPILSINGVKPDSTGNINLVSVSPHINVQHYDKNRILLTSGLNNVDFDRRALTDADGPVGRQGEDGLDAENKKVKPIPQQVDYRKFYGGGYLVKGSRFITKNIDADIVATNSLGETYAFSSKTGDYWVNIKSEVKSNLYEKYNIFELLSEKYAIPKEDIQEYLPLCACGYDDKFLVGSTVLVELYKNSVEILRDFIYPIKKVMYKLGNIFTLLENNQLWINNNVYAKNETINSFYYNNVLVGNGGRYDTTFTEPILGKKIDSNKNLYDATNLYLVGQGGTLFNISTGLFQNLYFNDDIYAIDTKDGFTVACGAGGALYYTDNDLDWKRVSFPQIKNFNSVSVISKNEAWVFGGY